MSLESFHRVEKALTTAADAFVERLPSGVKDSFTQLYDRTVGSAKNRYEKLSPEQQKTVLIASSATAAFLASHFLHRWWGSSSSSSRSDENNKNKNKNKNTAVIVKSNASNTIYESEASARQYMEFHYTPSKFTYVQRLKMVQESFDFPVRLVNKFRVYMPRTASFPSISSQQQQNRRNSVGKSPHIRKRRALDIGCATGASVFEMSKYFDEVVGIDYSEVFVHLANEVKEKSLKRPRGDGNNNNNNNNNINNNYLNIADNEPSAGKKRTSGGGGAAAAAYTIPYTAPVQGDNTESRELVLSAAVFPEKCFFYCGDAMNLFTARSGNFSLKDKRSTHYKDVFYWKAPLLVEEAAAPTDSDRQAFEENLTAKEIDMQADYLGGVCHNNNNNNKENNKENNNNNNKNGRDQAGEEGDERFDAVLCSNLIDRVPDPRKLLASFALLLRPGGVLVLCDPYSWWEGATDKEQWIGGRDGVRSEDEVKRILQVRFELLNETEEGFLIRDHIRHYQLGFSHCTVWRRR